MRHGVLAHTAISTVQEVDRSIPDSVIQISHWHNPACRTMALGSTHPLTELSTTNISLGKKSAGVQSGPYHRRDTSWSPTGLSRPVMRCRKQCEKSLHITTASEWRFRDNQS
jgi:hypothetical protein